MAYTIPNFANHVIGLEDYQGILSTIDFRDREEMIEKAHWFGAFCRNKKIIVDALNRALFENQLSISSTAGSILIYRHAEYTLRLNMWLPNATELASDVIDDGNSLQVHDHFFHFLTCGVLGDGYETDIYALKEPRPFRQVGDVVPMEFVETTTLPEGKLMYYRAREDAHSVRPPKSISVSANLVISEPTVLTHYYNVTNKTVAYIEGGDHVITGRNSILKLAAAFANDRTQDILLEIFHSSAHELNRVEALKALLQNKSSGDQEILLKMAAANSNSFIANYARQWLR